MQDLRLIPSVPDLRDAARAEEFFRIVRARINDLIRSGVIVGGSTPGSATLAVPLASPSGLELSSGLLRIDIDNKVLSIDSGGLDLATQKKNLVFSGPATGGDTTPTFRTLVAADVGTGTANSSTFLAGDMSWKAAAGPGIDPISSIYPVFTAAGDDDEFDDSNFTGWTLVDSGSHTPTVTETNNGASVSHPGNDASAELHAYAKTRTIAANGYVEAAFRSLGIAQNFNIAGVFMADGTTYNSGAQCLWLYSPNEGKWGLNTHSKYNTFGGTTGVNVQSTASIADMMLRLVYEGSNHFRGYVSPDGVSWIDVTGQITVTLTPTVAGFFVSTWGGLSPHVFAFRYVRFG